MDKLQVKTLKHIKDTLSQPLIDKIYNALFNKITNMPTLSMDDKNAIISAVVFEKNDAINEINEAINWLDVLIDDADIH